MLIWPSKFPCSVEPEPVQQSATEEAATAGFPLGVLLTLYFLHRICSVASIPLGFVVSLRAGSIAACLWTIFRCFTVFDFVGLQPCQTLNGWVHRSSAIGTRALSLSWTGAKLPGSLPVTSLLRRLFSACCCRRQRAVLLAADENAGDPVNEIAITATGGSLFRLSALDLLRVQAIAFDLIALAAFFVFEYVTLPTLSPACSVLNSCTARRSIVYLFVCTLQLTMTDFTISRTFLAQELCNV